MYIRSVSVENTDFTGESGYLNHIPAISKLGTLDLAKKPVTFFVGENGSGKSTLLESIAVAYGFNPEGGSRNFHFATVNTHSMLSDSIRLVKTPIRPKDGYFLRAESFYNLASNIDSLEVESCYGGASLHHQSHGESFLSLINNRLGGSGLYLFDEPEAALSPTRQLALLAIIHRLVKSKSQLLIATHSPILMAYPDAVIYLLNEDGILPVRYEDTEHVQITKRFMANPTRMLDAILKEE